jgi:hypothetical protein
VIRWSPHEQFACAILLGLRATLLALSFAALAWIARVPEAIEGIDYLNWQICAAVIYPFNRYSLTSSHDSSD